MVYKNEKIVNLFQWFFPPLVFRFIITKVSGNCDFHRLSEHRFLLETRSLFLCSLHAQAVGLTLNHIVARGHLEVEEGPSADVTLMSHRKGHPLLGCPILSDSFDSWDLLFGFPHGPFNVLSPCWRSCWRVLGRAQPLAGEFSAAGKRDREEVRPVWSVGGGCVWGSGAT